MLPKGGLGASKSGAEPVGISYALPMGLVDIALFVKTATAEHELESARNLAGAILSTLDLARDPLTVERCRSHVQKWTWQAVGSDLDRLQSLALDGRHAGASA